METIHRKETSPAKRFLPPHLLLGAILLSLALDRWLPLARLWQQPWIILGAGIIAIALAVNTFLAIGFLRRKTTVIPFRESTVLITDGLYRFSRNPIYLSMIVLLYGEAIALGSLSPWLAPTAFAAAVSRQFIQCEEAMLAEKFGDQYRDYCELVRRWL